MVVIAVQKRGLGIFAQPFSFAVNLGPFTLRKTALTGALERWRYTKRFWDSYRSDNHRIMLILCVDFTASFAFQLIHSKLPIKLQETCFDFWPCHFFSDHSLSFLRLEEREEEHLALVFFPVAKDPAQHCLGAHIQVTVKWNDPIRTLWQFSNSDTKVNLKAQLILSYHSNGNCYNYY